MSGAGTVEKIRSFIAIELPEVLKLRLSQLEAQLKADKSPGVRWVNPDSIHLTLKFLGSITTDRTGEITEAMMAASRNILPFHLEVKGLGVFPDVKRVQVAWVGISGELEKLGQLQQRLESRLEHLAFTREKRPFTAHLTLARVNRQVSPDDRQRFGQLITETGFEGGVIKVDAISLMRSELTRQGAIYHRISLARLGQNLANG